MLPEIQSLDDYRRVYRREEAWLPAMRWICQRHGLDEASLRLAPPGSHVVFWVEEDWLIKLFTPLFGDDAPKETLLLRALAAQTDFNVPRIRAQGVLEGWPYLALSRLPGEPLETLWGRLSPAEKEQIAASLGRLMAALHRTPTAGLEALHVDWAAFLAQQMATCLERQAAAGAPPAWLAEMAAFLGDLPALFEPGFQPVLLNADLNPEHLFCEETPQGWQITGVIDFGDAMLGHPCYEFVAPGFITRRAPALRRAMLLSYGYAPQALDASLSRRLMAYTLLHRFASLPDWLGLFEEDTPADLEEMQEALWRF